MQSLLIVPSRAYAAQTHTLPATAVPTGLTGVLVTLSRESWLLGGLQAISLQTELSFDNQATWQAGGGCTAQGGVVLDSHGVEQVFTTVSFALSQPLATRWIRGVVVLQQAITTRIEIVGLP